LDLAMSLTLEITFDSQDLARLQGFFEDMGRRAARSELLPILKEAFEPVVARERSILSGHVKSGALLASVKARTASPVRDVPGTLSVFSNVNATRRAAVKHWSRGRAQQRGWAAVEAAKGTRGRVKIFYGPIVHQGHGKAKPIPFARQAMEDVGEQSAETASKAILDHIVGD
jgi:hypothetical protein